MFGEREKERERKTEREVVCVCVCVRGVFCVRADKVLMRAPFRC